MHETVLLNCVSQAPYCKWRFSLCLHSRGLCFWSRRQVSGQHSGSHEAVLTSGPQVQQSL